MGFVGDFDVEGVAVCFCVDGDGVDACVFACLSDSDCDFASVCDENFGDGGHVGTLLPCLGVDLDVRVGGRWRGEQEIVRGALFGREE